MNREKAIDLLDNLIGMIEDNQESDYDTALKMAIQALSQEPCDDAVSRQAVLSKKIYTETEEGWSGYTVDADYIEYLPSVTQKSGKWNEYYTSQKGNDVFNCKECGHTFIVTQGKDNMNFCPNCGAKMEREEKE